MDKLNRWMTLFANLGVLVGIVFLAVQINQNSLMMESTLRFEIANSDSEALIQFSEHGEVWAKINQREIPEWDTPAQAMEAEWLLTAIFRKWEMGAWQHEVGRLDAIFWDGIKEDMRFRATQAYWVDQWRQTRTRYPGLQETLDPIFKVSLTNQ